MAGEEAVKVKEVELQVLDPPQPGGDGKGRESAVTLPMPETPTDFRPKFGGNLETLFKEFEFLVSYVRGGIQGFFERLIDLPLGIIQFASVVVRGDLVPKGKPTGTPISGEILGIMGIDPKTGRRSDKALPKATPIILTRDQTLEAFEGLCHGKPTDLSITGIATLIDAVIVSKSNGDTFQMFLPVSADSIAFADALDARLANIAKEDPHDSWEFAPDDGRVTLISYQTGVKQDVLSITRGEGYICLEIIAAHWWGNVIYQKDGVLIPDVSFTLPLQLQGEETDQQDQLMFQVGFGETNIIVDDIPHILYILSKIQVFLETILQKAYIKEELVSEALRDLSESLTDLFEHDVINMLTSAKGFLGTIRLVARDFMTSTKDRLGEMGTNAYEVVDDACEVIEKAIDRSVHLIRRFVEIFKGRKELLPISVTEVVKEALEISYLLHRDQFTEELEDGVRKEPKVQIFSNHHCTDLRALAFSGTVTAALINAIKNSIEQGVGRIYIIVSVVEDDGQSYVRITVQDDGDGAPEHILEAINEGDRVVSTKGERGRGKALSLLGRIIRFPFPKPALDRVKPFHGKNGRDFTPEENEAQLALLESYPLGRVIFPSDGQVPGESLIRIEEVDMTEILPGLHLSMLLHQILEP